MELLAPACERIEIAGSIRRGKDRVKDIEIVAAPKVPTDLFGEIDSGAPTHLETIIEEAKRNHRVAPRLRDDGVRIAWGPRFKAMMTDDGFPVDLFMVVPPAQWGAIYAIRTGPGDFSKYLVTAAQSMGVRCESGALRRSDGSIVETPEEKDFFKACGIPWVEPEDRR